MHSVSVTVKTKEDPNIFWDKIMDVKNWDKLIKFVKKIYIKNPVLINTNFYDVTTIFWFPVKIEHTITEIEKNKKFYMEANLPFHNGKMFQTIDINTSHQTSIIKIQIKFYINFFLFDLLFGKLLEV